MRCTRNRPTPSVTSEDRLQGHCHHPRTNACDPEIPPLATSLHAGAHLRRHGAPRFGDAGAALVGLTVGGRADSDFEALGNGEDGESKQKAPMATCRYIPCSRASCVHGGHRRRSPPMGILFFHPLRRRAVFPFPRLFSSPTICDRRQRKPERTSRTGRGLDFTTCVTA